ncbi:MAG: T9SS type A sorting domain-containing protein [Melioribacteraceae bacterium]|nr:T9SS type A sorting domain-containing protein [Melioribacteraceae bacterium]
MIKNIYKLVLIAVILHSIETQGRDWRTNQLPNGSKFSCSNCHVNPNGGGTLNKFGEEVSKLVTVGGTQNFWSATLAKIDSDGDGKTNGEELGDPEGLWRTGQTNPGVFASITNPGNPNSVTSVEQVAGLPSEFKLEQNFPNPFNPETIINYQVAEISNVKLTIYDLLGKEVSILVNKVQSPGYYSAKFSADNSQISTGIFIYRLEVDKVILTKKMMLIK